MIADVPPLPSAVRLHRQQVATAVATLVLASACSTQDIEVRRPLPVDATPGAPTSGGPDDDVARYLAGLPGTSSSPYAALRQAPSWTLHSGLLDNAFRTAAFNRLDAAEGWAAAALGDLRYRARGGTVFYPFSGPDFLYADTFFPGARTYILFGLEPVGPVPDPATYTAHDLASVRESLSSLLATSYFITSEMRQDFGGGGIPGTLSSLYIFITRSGHSITGVQPVVLASDGTAVPSGGFGGYNSGIRITFRTSHGQLQELFYFQTNVANGSLSPAFVAFVNRHAPVVTFMKSASYLMHTAGFSSIRNTILSTSVAIVQDDSAIPFRYLHDGGFAIDLFGHYQGTIDIFSEYYQADLAAAFARSQPLGFGVGYQRAYNKAPLLVARKAR
ncbi:hypothetical protein BH23VER1_BH23VER1_26930 [soil metagenome]